jgi:hypothetical protein
VKDYPPDFIEDGSHGRCYRLLSRAGVRQGVVLDLGCARGPLAEPVSSLDLEYVGADIDRDALDVLAARGFETHPLDLTADEDELVDALEGMLGGRALAAVLLLDVIEHLVDAGPLLRALARLDAKHDGIHLIVSIPNVTHVDVGIKLLLGRWDMTDIGLLDDTHLRFFTDRTVRATLAGGGWVEADADDVVNAFSDQLFPADAPALRPGAPLRQLLWRVRTAAADHGETYQFIRRFVCDHEAAAALAGRLAAEVDEDEVLGAAGSEQPLLTAVVDGRREGDGAVHALRRDLAAQGRPDVEILVVGGADAGRPADGTGPAVRVLPLPDEGSWRNAALAAARGRYVTFLRAGTRVAPGYLDAMADAVDALPARVVQVSVAGSDAEGLTRAASADFATAAAAAEPLAIDMLDLVGMGALGPVPLDAHAVPREAWRTNGLAFVDDDDPATLLFLVRAVEMCGIVRTSERLVVVDRDAVDLAGDHIDEVAKHLDHTPTVLPEGAASQIYSLRAAHESESAARAALEVRLAELEDQVRSLSALLRQRDAETGEAIAEAESLRSTVERSAILRARRRISRVLRRI